MHARGEQGTAFHAAASGATSAHLRVQPRGLERLLRADHGVLQAVVVSSLALLVDEAADTHVHVLQELAKVCAVDTIGRSRVHSAPVCAEVPDLCREFGGEFGRIEAVDEPDAALASQQAAREMRPQVVSSTSKSGKIKSRVSSMLPVIERVHIVAEARGDAHAGDHDALSRIPGRCFTYDGAACAASPPLWMRRPRLSQDMFMQLGSLCDAVKLSMVSS